MEALLWTDESPSPACAAANRLSPRGGAWHPKRSWRRYADFSGAVFPCATLAGLWAVAHDCDRYPQTWRPVVTASRNVPPLFNLTLRSMNAEFGPMAAEQGVF